MWKRYPAYAGLYIWILASGFDSMMGMGALAWMDYRVVIYLLLIAQTDVLRRQGWFIQQQVQHRLHGRYGVRDGLRLGHAVPSMRPRLVTIALCACATGDGRSRC